MSDKEKWMHVFINDGMSAHVFSFFVVVAFGFNVATASFGTETPFE